MEKYTFLEHTADTEFQAFGTSLEEAFINAALATTDVVIEVNDVELITEKKLHVESESKESLLYDFLEKVLLLMDSDHFVIGEFS
ncbi:MAG TPA: archease, partial [Candidatus Nanoarchaeia archaeon]|nr:archease [Candidatus Nanoarchaeia archaeon]